jgi:hypothetical protein
LVWQVLVSARDFTLDRGGAGKCLGDRSEIRKHSITGIMDDAAAMLFYSVADEVQVLAQPAMSTLLILSRETGGTRDIRVQNGGELTRQTVSHMQVPF